ncbi:hypothetical protein HYW32_02410 [Candidatus Berkelbacteria bacterium]|nr:hypothetical protein [Candidatus Berkelbacteria bacterium]
MYFMGTAPAGAEWVRVKWDGQNLPGLVDVKPDGTWRGFVSLGSLERQNGAYLSRDKEFVAQALDESRTRQIGDQRTVTVAVVPAPARIEVDDLEREMRMRAERQQVPAWIWWGLGAVMIVILWYRFWPRCLVYEDPTPRYAAGHEIKLNRPSHKGLCWGGFAVDERTPLPPGLSFVDGQLGNAPPRTSASGILAGTPGAPAPPAPGAPAMAAGTYDVRIIGGLFATTGPWSYLGWCRTTVTITVEAQTRRVVKYNDDIAVVWEAGKWASVKPKTEPKDMEWQFAIVTVVPRAPWLAVNPTTGELSGRPPAPPVPPVAGAAPPPDTWQVVVWATNVRTPIGVVPITVTIHAQAPEAQTRQPSLTYEVVRMACRPGQLVSPNAPRLDPPGTLANGYTILPDLPGGMVCRPSDGIIAGTPGAERDGQTYTIQAWNGPAFVAQAAVWIEVKAPGAPAGGGK